MLKPFHEELTTIKISLKLTRKVLTSVKIFWFFLLLLEICKL